MKYTRLLIALLVTTAWLQSCKKDDCNCKPTATKGNLIRFQQGDSPNLALDTVKLFKYDSLDRVSMVIDSFYRDTMFATYDALNRLVKIRQINHNTNGDLSYVNSDSAKFTYDAAGLLIQIDHTGSGERRQQVFVYNGSTVVRSNYYTDFRNPGPLQLWRFYTYEMTGGNITNVKEFTANGNWVDQTFLTYGSQPNPFKQLALFNFGNRLGLTELVDFETYFNANILTGFKNNTHSAVHENTFNNINKPAKIVSRYEFDGTKFDYIFTRYFNYN